MGMFEHKKSACKIFFFFFFKKSFIKLTAQTHTAQLAPVSYMGQEETEALLVSYSVRLF